VETEIYEVRKCAEGAEAADAAGKVKEAGVLRRLDRAAAGDLRELDRVSGACSRAYGGAVQAVPDAGGGGGGVCAAAWGI
jgi:hypothetical protein